MAVNNKCPHCGSDKIVADIDIRITGKLDERGEIHALDFWKGPALDNEAIAETPSEDIHGFCSDCGEYCDFSWDTGFFTGKKEEPKRNVDTFASMLWGTYYPQAVLTKLGKFQVDGGLYVSDPCYGYFEDGTNEAGYQLTVPLHNVLPGTYHAYVGTQDVEEWGIRNMYLAVIHEDVTNLGNIIATTKKAAVNSEELGIFLADKFKAQDKDREEHNRFDEACLKCCSHENITAGIVDGYGAVSRSGFGDGTYNVEIDCCEDGKVCGVAAIFI